jgi:hypothetical protein
MLPDWLTDKATWLGVTQSAIIVIMFIVLRLLAAAVGIQTQLTFIHNTLANIERLLQRGD